MKTTDLPACERCGSREGIELEPARTAYNPEPGKPDPNAPVWLCRPCAKEHHEHWDEMWSHTNDKL